MGIHEPQPAALAGANPSPPPRPIRVYTIAELEAGFHYPELSVQKGQHRKRSMQAVLETLGKDVGAVTGETIGDARFLFADDIASILVGRALTGHLTPSERQDLDTLGRVSNEVEEGIAAFVRFVSDVLGRYLRLAIERGAEVKTIADPLA